MKKDWENYTKRGIETDLMGMLAENIVKKELRNLGYSIVHQKKYNALFDLLVEEKFRVEVKTAKQRKGSWNIMLSESNKYDILAVVLRKEFLKEEIIFFTKKNINKYNTARFSLAISEKSKMMKFAVKNPYEIFGKPIKE